MREQTEEELMGHGMELIALVVAYQKKHDINPLDICFLVSGVATSLLHGLKDQSIIKTISAMKGTS